MPLVLCRSAYVSWSLHARTHVRTSLHRGHDSLSLISLPPSLPRPLWPRGSIEEIIKLDSINEGEVKTHMSASAHNAHMYEQALSARLASMEQSGAFGTSPSCSVSIHLRALVHVS